MTVALRDPLSGVVFDAEVQRIFHAEGDPVTIARAALDRWGLTSVSVIGQGALSVCLEVVDHSGQVGVLKAGTDGALVASEVAGLGLWEASGVFPRVLIPGLMEEGDESEGAEVGGAYVMSKVEGRAPGSYAPGRDEERAWMSERAGELWARWQCRPDGSDPWGQLEGPDEVFGRRAQWARRRCEGSDGVRPFRGLLDWAEEEAVALSDACTTPGLCHGDFSPRNLLIRAARGRRHVRVCDPMPYLGDPVSDVAHWSVLCCVDRAGRGIEANLDRAAGMLELNREHLYAWARVAAVFEANLAQRPDNPAAAWLASTSPVGS